MDFFCIFVKNNTMTRKEIAKYPNHIDTYMGKLYKRKTAHGVIYLLNGNNRGYVFGETAFHLQDAVNKFLNEKMIWQNLM